MPLYQFKCKQCNKITEEIVKLNVTHVECHACGDRAEKILSLSNFIIHGYSYKNLYSSQKASSPKTTSSKQPQ